MGILLHYNICNFKNVFFNAVIDDFFKYKKVFFNREKGSL